MAKYYAYTLNRLFDIDGWQKTKRDDFRQALSNQRAENMPNVNENYYRNHAKFMADRIRQVEKASNPLVLVEIDLLDYLIEELDK